MKSLGADCMEKPATEEDRERLSDLLRRAGVADEVSVDEFRMYGSARELYHFHVDNVASY